MSNIPTVQTIYQCFGQGDIPGILAHVTPDIAWEQWKSHSAQSAGVPWSQGGSGPDAVVAFFTALGTALEFKRFDVLNIMEGGNEIAATVESEVVVRATGETAVIEEIHQFTFNEEGKVGAFRHYLDTAQQIRLAGLG